MTTTPKINITSAFASPIAATYLSDCERLNAELKALFLSREHEGERYRKQLKTPTLQVNIFESEFELFRWPEPAVQELYQFCMQSLMKVVMQLNRYEPEQMRKLEIRDHTWFHITRFGGYIANHNHPMASWSGVYCVAAGENPPEWPDSGVLRFLNPRAGSFMYLDHGNANLQSPFDNSSLNFRLQPGQLILFPSYLDHEVAPFFGSDERITVAFNAWFRDTVE
ncbi:MAG: hypothetical protein HYV16_05115 [Gammaproteobacteria bacterium]|nr:hypothetical protein [Gammaproteobacteria bacterium]